MRHDAPPKSTNRRIVASGVPESFANGAMDGIVTRLLAAGEHRMRISANRSSDFQGAVARLLRTASVTATAASAVSKPRTIMISLALRRGPALSRG